MIYELVLNLISVENILFLLVAPCLMLFIGNIFFEALFKDDALCSDTLTTNSSSSNIIVGSFENLLSRAVYLCTFEGAAGGVIKDYFDVDTHLTSGQEISALIVDRLVEILEEYPDHKICFLEMDAGPVGLLSAQTAISNRLNKKTSVIRLQKDVHRMALKGENINEGDKVVVLQDVYRTGFHIQKASKILSYYGAKISQVISLVERENNGVSYSDVDVKSIARFEDLKSIKDKETRVLN